MPKKRKQRKKRQPQYAVVRVPMGTTLRGDGLFGDIWGGIKKGANASYGFAKKTKIISSVLSQMKDPRAKAAAGVFRAVGLGKKPKTRRRGRPCKSRGKGLTTTGGGRKKKKVGRPKKRAVKRGRGLKISGSGKRGAKKTSFP